MNGSTRGVGKRGSVSTPDFVHIIADGGILRRQEELEYLGKHSLPPQDHSRRSLEAVKVRLMEMWESLVGEL